MPLLRPSNEKTRVELPAAGEWVEVKTRPSVGDVKAVQGTALAFTLRVKRSQLDAIQRAETEAVAGELLDGLELPIDGDLFDRMAFTRLERAIVAWSFDDPVTPENIRMLDPESYDVIAAALDRLWGQGRGNDEKKG